ncbi:hypothetical protein E1293_36210 [Actinomadura darangshiensis]|uniref:Uncharacterized protein n=1 Tax=Actinomadura darangshiensis TaxID=705336 RepID=A0A4R5ADH9_9ACTN|nr:hypothetical protein [Actinomadura darangshiensis]TDD69159.1 hypothetical protein E1293_36210 [Actinomadura darangshiensis]
MAWGPAEHQQGLLAGGDLFRHVLTGGELEPLPYVSMLLREEEFAYAELPLEYSRFYAMDVSYEQHSVVAFGSAGFLLGALAVNAAGNAIARNRAQALAAAQWREHQVARVFLTSERLMIVAHAGALSFWHEGLSEFFPAPDQFQLLLTFPDCEPVQLRGPKGHRVRWWMVTSTPSPYVVASVKAQLLLSGIAPHNLRP